MIHTEKIGALTWKRIQQCHCKSMYVPCLFSSK